MWTRLKIRVQFDPRPIPELFQEEQTALARNLSKLKCRYLQKEFDIMQYMLLLSSLIHDYTK